MIDAEDPLLVPPLAAADAADVDPGLRAFLLGVLAKLALGLLLAGGVAFIISATPGVRDQLFTLRSEGGRSAIALAWPGALVVVSPLIALLLFSRGVQTPRRSAVLYWSIAATVGASLSTAVATYTGASLATAFAATAAGFGALSLYGYATKRDLSSMAAFFTTGLVGLIAALILNLMIGSAALTFVINGAGVLLFAGLIAHDMQRLKFIYDRAQENSVDMAVATNTGALSLFLDFVNLFQFLLAGTGERQ